MTTPKFPEITVKLCGEDGNSFALLARTRTALQRGGATPEEQAAFFKDATSGNYDHVLRTIMAWVNVE